MSVYKFSVVETRQYIVEYTVEADSDDEAMGLAQCGETLTEGRATLNAVSDRWVAKMLSRDVEADKGD